MAHTAVSADRCAGICSIPFVLWNSIPIGQFYVFVLLISDAVLGFRPRCRHGSRHGMRIFRDAVLAYPLASW